MTKIAAVFEKGVFRPSEPVSLEEGTHVELFIDEQFQAKGTQHALQWIEELAAVNEQGPADGFSGSDHDTILYGGDSRHNCDCALIFHR